MNQADEKRINHYANSMFRFEFLNDSWIESCTSYLKLLFGDTLKDKIVVDYAFGRGNWSLAFLKAGASKVISIDASHDNVSRFSEYCKVHGVVDISVIHGNILEADIEYKGDLFWLYGILHHLENLDLFLTKIKSMASNQQAKLYVYFYNKNSLREWVIEFSRSLHVYRDESEFLEDNLLFIRTAKGRASDDLTAPIINWFTANEFQSALEKNGIYVERQDSDFYEFQNGRRNEEFCPHQFLCKLDCSPGYTVTERKFLFPAELEVLTTLGEDIKRHITSTQIRKNISIGVFNTHFCFLKNNSIEESLLEIFLFLMRVIIQSVEMQKAKFGFLSEAYYNLMLASLSGSERSTEVFGVERTLFSDYLVKNQIRI